MSQWDGNSAFVCARVCVRTLGILHRSPLSSSLRNEAAVSQSRAPKENPMNPAHMWFSKAEKVSPLIPPTNGGKLKT